LEQLSNLTDHCIDFVNNALNKGSDMALLYSKRYSRIVIVLSATGLFVQKLNNVSGHMLGMVMVQCV
jgi:hypothetical protein